jgi:hypothetical protein
MTQYVAFVFFLRDFLLLSTVTTLGHSPCNSTWKPPQVWFPTKKDNGERYKLGARNETAKAKSLASERITRSAGLMGDVFPHVTGS